MMKMYYLQCVILLLGMLEISCRGNISSSDPSHQTKKLGVWTHSFNIGDYGLGTFDIEVQKKSGEKRIEYVDIVAVKQCDGCPDEYVEQRVPSTDGWSIQIKGWDPTLFKYELRVQVAGYIIFDNPNWYDFSFRVSCRNCYTSHCPKESWEYCPMGQECVDDVCQAMCGDPCIPSSLCYGDENGNKEYFDIIDDGSAHDPEHPMGRIARCSSECINVTAWAGSPEKGAVRCGGTCVNVRSDKNNCGFCGRACLSNEICYSGSCIDCSNNQLCQTDDYVKNCNGVYRYQSPYMPEVCNNGIDDDCDGKTDDESCTYLCLSNGIQRPNDCPYPTFCNHHVCQHVECDCKSTTYNFCNAPQPGTVCSAKNICEAPEIDPTTQRCIKHCEGKACGDCDGCGGLCDGPCQSPNATCISGTCQCNWGSCDNLGSIACCSRNEQCMFVDSMFQCACPSSQVMCNGNCCAQGEVCINNQTCGVESSCIEPGHSCNSGTCCYLDSGAACDPGFKYCCWTEAGHSCNSNLECCGTMMCSTGTFRACYQP